MKNYIIEFENYEDFTLGDFIEVIRKTEGIPLNELKVKDLTYYNDEFIEGGCGVYIFKEKEDIILVGKAETVSFTERIAKHFDLRTNAWFNRLLYIISMKKLGFLQKLNLKCKTTKNNIISSYKEDYFFDRKKREDRVLDDLDRLFQN